MVSWGSEYVFILTTEQPVAVRHSTITITVCDRRSIRPGSAPASSGAVESDEVPVFVGDPVIDPTTLPHERRGVTDMQR